MLIVYIGALAALLIQSFFHLDGFTGQVVRQFSLATYVDLLTVAHFAIVGRTVVMAAAVTVASALLAFPLAYYSVRYAPPQLKGLLYLAVLLPLWSSYIIRVYSWKLILATRQAPCAPSPRLCCCKLAPHKVAHGASDWVPLHGGATPIQTINSSSVNRSNQHVPELPTAHRTSNI
jgi:hypothetical protein